MTEEAPSVIASQNASHGAGHDYVKGSPHLRHTVLRTMIATQLRALVRETLERQGTCRVLEVGAGHGTFTDFLLAAGAEVTVTEASEASAALLTTRYADREDVEVFYDRSGEDIFSSGQHYDGVVCASLLHHIPDYITFVSRLSALVDPGGWFYSVQDPTYYPRRKRRVHLAGRGTFFAWRIAQGDLRRGLGAFLRRRKGAYSDTDPSDLVEYHVVRQGVDELALVSELQRHFDDVELFTYWSTQSPVFQRLFAPAHLGTDFGLIGQSRLETSPPAT